MEDLEARLLEYEIAGNFWQISRKNLEGKTRNQCCGNHLSQRQIITQAVNLLSWISSGKLTRELNKESLFN